MPLSVFVFRFERSIRMTKQEIKRETRETEGDPLVKARIRSLMRSLSRKRMLRDVGKADVIVTNPTHYAVALHYSVETPGAPRVVAKGKNYLALRIKQKAIDAGVPIVENPPLAQALYKSVEVGQEMTIRAVAREPGYRAKIAVSSIDLKVDCVGACVGVRGSRIKNIIEKTDYYLATTLHQPWRQQWKLYTPIP